VTEKKTPLRIEKFSELIDGYRAIFFDSFGVLRDARGILDGVAEVLIELKDRGKRVYVLTNDSSRSPQELARALEHPVFGQLISPDQIISSGLLTTRYLARKVSGTVAFLGKDASAHYIRAAGIRAIPVSECGDEEINALALLDDEGFDWNADLNAALNLARRGPIPVVVANADLAYPSDSENIALAVGSLARMLEGVLGRRFIYFGKPDTSIFSYGWAQVQAIEPEISKDDVLMVGDTLETDILGANQFGIPSALVLSGNTREADAARGIEGSAILPDHICRSIME